MSLIALAFATVLAGRQPVAETPCEMDYRSEACEQARLSQTLADFGLQTAEAEAATGAEIYRLFLRNPWGRTQPVVSFERHPGEPPAVVVKAISGDSLYAHVSREVWEQVVDGAIYADRELVPVPLAAPPSVSGEDEIYEVFCTDASTVVIELANTRDRWGDPVPVRRNRQNTCDRGLATVYGALLTELAVKSLPSCAVFGPVRGFEGMDSLGACLMLREDTMAAAELLKSKGEIPGQFGEGPVPADVWAAWLNTDGTGRIDWAGEQLAETSTYSATGPRPARLSDFMARRSSELGNLRIYVARVGAGDADHGWMEVEIVHDADGDGRMIATSRQTWRRRHDDWALESWTVSPFRPLPPTG